MDVANQIRALRQVEREKLLRAVQTALEDGNRRGRNGGLLDSDVTDVFISHYQQLVRAITSVYERDRKNSDIKEADISGIATLAAEDIAEALTDVKSSMESYVREPSSRESLILRLQSTTHLATDSALAELRVNLRGFARGNADKIKNRRVIIGLGILAAVVALAVGYMQRPR